MPRGGTNEAGGGHQRWRGGGGHRDRVVAQASLTAEPNLSLAQPACVKLAELLLEVGVAWVGVLGTWTGWSGSMGRTGQA